MSSFELRDPDVFTAGAVGEPGGRVFFMQVRDDELVVTVRCEKQQVLALAEYFGGLLEDLEPAPYGVARGDLELVEPVQEIWTVGPIGVAYDEPADRIVVVLEELVEEGQESASVRVSLNRAQTAAFALHARKLAAAGRPLCRFCGLPLDPEGHGCPKMN